MHLQRILIYCLSFVMFTSANNLKKDVKEPKVHAETVRLAQPKRSTINDNSFMPVFLTSSNVKANDFTQEMLKSLASNSYIKPSVKLSTNKVSNVSTNKQLPKSAISNKENKKLDKTIKSETVVTRWSKAGTSSNFSPTLPINLSKMHFDTTGFIPIVPKQATRSSSNAKLIKQASKPPVRPLVDSRTVPFAKLQTTVPAKIVQQTPKLTSTRTKATLPNPSVRALKPVKSNVKPTVKPNPKVTTSKQVPTAAKSSTSTPKLTTSKLTTTNAKIVDNRPIAAASSTELSSYLSSQLNSRDARKALLKMNTLRYLAKLSPQWSASSLSETYQSGGSLKAYPIGKITVPADQGSYGESGYKKKPEISIELIKEILHKLTNDEVQFNKLYVMGTHRPKGQENTMNNEQQQYDQPIGQDGYNQPDNGEPYQNGDQYQQDGGSYQDQNSNGYQPDQGNYNQPENGDYNPQDQGGYNQPENGDYNQQDQGGYNQQQGDYNQPDNGGYSQPDYSQGDQQGGNYENNGGGNSYDSGSYSNDGDSYSKDNGNGYSNEGGDNSYNQNEGGPYNTGDNGNSYQNGGTDEEQGYHLQSLGYDMSEYTNRAYVPAYSLNSLASFVHNRFKEIAMKKQMGEYSYEDNPYLNNYDNYKMMDVNYAQYVPDKSTGGRKKKCSKNHGNNQNNQNGGYANNDVNRDVSFDDSYNNYVINLVPGSKINFKAKK